MFSSASWAAERLSENGMWRRGRSQRFSNGAPADERHSSGIQEFAGFSSLTKVSKILGSGGFTR